MLNVQVLSETIVRFSERNKLPGKPSYHALRRWAKKGIPSRVNDERVSLEYAYIGCSPATSVEAYARFSLRLNGVTT